MKKEEEREQAELERLKKMMEQREASSSPIAVAESDVNPDEVLAKVAAEKNERVLFDRGFSRTDEIDR